MSGGEKTVGGLSPRMAALFLALAVYGADLLSKLWVQRTSRLHHYEILEGYLRLHYVRNEGIAFGLFHTVDSDWKPIILSLLALVAIVIVLYYIFACPPHNRLLLLSLGLLLGGILGNFTDRLMHGYVVDFIELHWRDRFHWPTFNVADAAITSGVFLILFETFALQPDHERAEDRESVEPNERA